ncbi:hypothetical protein SAMN05661099_1602 [Daejeonella lutea]|uniref:Uncharacterized protein n=1 Tax=Daejeonella lutea TaxID=572036 RepID=A0A1T5BKZ4_9SPHI|nr:hypothetical protein SAMN05661099_1602 [Daejeonella lutea]
MFFIGIKASALPRFLQAKSRHADFYDKTKYKGPEGNHECLKTITKYE